MALIVEVAPLTQPTVVEKHRNVPVVRMVRMQLDHLERRAHLEAPNPQLKLTTTLKGLPP